MRDQLSKRIVNIAWPAILEMSLYMVIGIVDVAFVGRLGAVQLAGIALGAEFFFGVVLALAGLGVGGTILAAQYTGAGSRESVDKTASQVLIIAFIVGIITTAAGWLLTPDLIGLFSVEKAVAAVAIKYMRTTLLFSPLVLCLFMGNGIFRGNGNTRVPMTIAFITVAVNILGCYFLIFGNGGFPRLEGWGSAVATSFANSVGFILMITAMLSGRWGVKLHAMELVRPSWKTISKILGLGVPSTVEEFLRTAGILAGSFLLVNLGTQAFAAHQIAVTAESISYMPGYGLAIAATSIVGQSLGAGQAETARQAAYKAFRFAMIIMGAAGLVFFAAPEMIARLFTNQAGLISTSAVAIRIAAFEQIAIAAEMVFAGALRGAGNTRSPMIVALFGTWLFRLPLLLVVIRILHLGLAQVWLLFVADWALRSIIMYVIFLRFDWETAKLGVSHQSE